MEAILNFKAWVWMAIRVGCRMLFVTVRVMPGNGRKEGRRE